MLVLGGELENRLRFRSVGGRGRKGNYNPLFWRRSGTRSEGLSIQKSAVLFLLAVLAVPSFSQSVADPFTQYGGLIMEGRIQNMAANISGFFILHRVLGKDNEVVES